MTTTAENILAMSIECARGVYGARPPSSMYAVNVALLLAGTAATESHLQYRRQVGYGYGEGDGAFGLWQTEDAPITDNVALLKRKPALAQNASRYLHGEAGDMDAILAMGSHGLVRLCAGWDRFACLMDRIHYMRFPAPVPGNDAWRADYYKKYYNTTAGKGSAAKYLEDYHRLISPVLKAGL